MGRGGGDGRFVEEDVGEPVLGGVGRWGVGGLEGLLRGRGRVVVRGCLWWRGERWAVRRGCVGGGSEGSGGRRGGGG